MQILYEIIVYTVRRMKNPGHYVHMQSIRKWLVLPLPGAFFISLLLAVVLWPYWWLAVQWSDGVIASPDARFTFSTTTFLMLLIILDSAFMIRYYQLVRRLELDAKTADLRRSEDALRVANTKIHLLSEITRHDIRNQLTALKGYLELSGHVLDNRERLADFLTKELRIAGAIERQINFTKDYEEMGVIAPVWQNIPAIMTLVSKDLPLNDVHIDARPSRLEVFADPLLVKVFYNLIDNSLRYGGEALTTITLDEQEQNGGLLVIVRDDGAGISAEDKMRLFTRGFGKKLRSRSLPHPGNPLHYRD